VENKEKNTVTPSNSFSIKEFCDIFLRIDEQILQLHQCSSDDFLGLNTDFKQYFKQSKIISDNASEIFRSLTEVGSGALLQDLESLYKELKLIQNNFSKHLGKTIELLRDMFALLDKLFLPVKNLNQDLMTLKFLLANLKISNTTSKNLFEDSTEKLLVTFNQIINNFKICSFQNETNLVSLKDQVKKTLYAFEKIKARNIYDFDTILNHIHFGIIFFAEKHEEVSRLIPELTCKTKNSSQSIADIITNLQYHDIIRQKMEHIQTTQKKVLADLDSIEVSAKDNGFEKLLIRIRDIANLQSAQLVHANKEYQQAIENITQKFIAIGDDMATISAMCQEINASQENNEELHLQGLLDKLHNSANVLTLYVEAGDSFTQHLDILSDNFKSTAITISEFSVALKDLKEITTNTLENFKDAISKDEQLQKSLLHVRNLCDEVEKFEGIIQHVFQVVNGIEHDIHTEIQQHIESTNENVGYTQAADIMNSIIKALNDKNQMIQKLLEENLTTSQTISQNVGESIKKIKYYDFFEKVIVDIIGEFNQISHKLRLELGVETNEKNEELDSLKSLYTMASEHQIHDKVVSNQGDVDLFDDGVEKLCEEDENLELF
jgi:hypothetical protein